jgi:hypothetical protein
MAHSRVAAAIGCAIVVVGCGASAPAPSSPPGPAPAAPAEASFEGTRWGTYHSRRFELSLGLPDGSSWKIDDHHSPWMRAGHEATRSTLLLRSWSEDQNVTRKACYARAREWEPALPDIDVLTLIDDGMRKVMGDKDARVAVGVVPPGAPEATTGGFVVAIVGSVRRCLVVAFQTQAGGPAAGDEVAGRLALVADRLVPSLKLDQSFAPSREPLTGSPVAPGAGGVR